MRHPALQVVVVRGFRQERAGTIEACEDLLAGLLIGFVGVLGVAIFRVGGVVAVGN